MKGKNFMYDENFDRLMVFNNPKNDKVKDNYLLGDFVVSLTENGEVVGLEIIGISRVFEDYDLDPRILDNIKDVQLKVIARKGAIYIFFDIDSEVDMKPINQKIPLIMPINQ